MPAQNQSGFTLAKPRYPLEEAAVELLGISVPTLYRRAAKGLIRLDRDGRRTFISAPELERYLLACQQAPTTP
jgi:excisionase family DNA binding protein